MIRKLEVVFGNWKVVFGNWTVVSETRQWYSETGQWYSETGTWYSETRQWYSETGQWYWETGTWYSETGLGKLGVVLGNLGVVFGNWELYSETDIIGSWNPGTEKTRDTTTERWFDFFSIRGALQRRWSRCKTMETQNGCCSVPAVPLGGRIHALQKKGENGFVDEMRMVSIAVVLQALQTAISCH